MPAKLDAPTITGVALGSVTLSFTPIPDVPITVVPGSGTGIYFEVKWMGSTRTFLCDTATSCRVTYLDASMSYQFSVRMHNPTGPGPWSEFSSAVIPNVVPAAPLSPNAISFAPGEITVSFVLPVNAVPIDRITIECDNGETKTPTGVSNFVVFSGFAPGEYRSFRITAFNSVGSASTAWFGNWST